MVWRDSGCAAHLWLWVGRVTPDAGARRHAAPAEGVWESEGGLVGDTLFECVVVMENEVLGQEEMLGLMERDWEGDRVRQAVDVRDTELQGVGVWDRVGVDVGQ